MGALFYRKWLTKAEIRSKLRKANTHLSARHIPRGKMGILVTHRLALGASLFLCRGEEEKEEENRK